MSRKTHRSKSHKRRHSRRHTRKNGGGCTSCTMRGQWGGRGGLGGAEVGHAFTTGASQTLYQMTGRTPGLFSGGVSKSEKKRRNERRAAAAAERNVQRAIENAERRAILAALAQNAASKGRKRTRRMNFKKEFVTGMPLPGYEGNEFRHLSRNQIKNMIRAQARSKYINMFNNNEGFNEINLELNNNEENMGKVILPGNSNPYLHTLRNRTRKNKKN